MGKSHKRTMPLSDRELRFAGVVATMRRARGLSQAALAERAGLAVDTIGRLERGAFSPSLETLFKLADGLSVPLSTVLLGFEGLERDGAGELVEVARGLGAAERGVALRVLVALVGLVRGVGEGGE